MGEVKLAYKRNLDIKEFLEIEDEELKRYIFASGEVNSEVKMFTINNDAKVGFYICTIDVKQNAKGIFYRNSILSSYIIYDKNNKKVKTKNVSYNLEKYFIESYFLNYTIIKKFYFSLTKTLIKFIVTEKIKTISDIMDYHKSFTFKNKNISNKNLYNMFLSGYASATYCIDNLDNEEITFRDIINTCKSIDPRFIYVKAYKFSINEKDVKKKSDEWAVRQNIKYDSFIRSRDEIVGKVDI